LNRLSRSSDFFRKSPLVVSSKFVAENDNRPKEKGIFLMKLNRLASFAVLIAGAIGLTATSATAATIIGGDTSVALNSATATALVGLGFTITPVSPATLAGLTADFPITGGNTTSAITHSGGLAFTKGGVTTDITNFTINLLNGTLFGNVNGGNTPTTFFDLGAGNVLTLDATLAGALTSIYSIPNLTGATIGVATVNASVAPEPSTLCLAALCGLGILALGRRRQQRC
jgi:PEP-CTERM motif-containing protein